ncbi:serine protease inhibitor [Arthrobacter sp. FW306-05-C]|uniref:SSI family serine proteinase inhibitor n=1 Tax=unclassified Arthrobacter TaxID=235627 RepID=UPI001EEFAD72|nr:MULTISPECIES: SSI family serine proteinase inhibitor [unclassified Arthrobacter]UKA67354.1 serine protease inhibitor [Arthrobacter sp. FW306-05-C]UKA75987.1 serine protease inhibitor [Arthrobacter sp. FW306-07-I]
MRNIRTLAVFLAVTAGLVSGCSGTPDSGTSASTAPSTNPGSSSSSAAGSATPSPDTETSVAAPAPATSRPSAGPGQGNAELAITVVPSQGAAELDYTLVCSSGTPAAESSHPNAAAACAAIKANPDILAPSKPSGAQACTQQYGGPQKATITGVVDGVAVDSSFARTNGCEISAWDAAKDVLGAAGGAS